MADAPRCRTWVRRFWIGVWTLGPAFLVVGAVTEGLVRGAAPPAAESSILKIAYAMQGVGFAILGGAVGGVFFRGLTSGCAFATPQPNRPATTWDAFSSLGAVAATVLCAIYLADVFYTLKTIDYGRRHHAAAQVEQAPQSRIPPPQRMEARSA